MSGWIKLHRSLLDWEWYSDSNTSRLFIHCLLRANYEDRKWRGKLIKRGTFYTSLETLASETGLSVRQIRTSLDKLEMTGEVTSSGQARGRVITVVQYDSYQADDKLEVSKMTVESSAKSQAGDRLMTTNKNIISKEEKNNKHIDQSEIDRLFELFWIAGMKKANKKAARKSFSAIIKRQPDKQSFTDMLINDVRQRIIVGQMGFTDLHPTTYLNGERWNDEIKQPQSATRTHQPSSAYERSRAALAEQEAAVRRRMEQCGAVNGEAMGEAGADVRPQVSQPVRGVGKRDMGEVLDGDYWPAGGERSE